MTAKEVYVIMRCWEDDIGEDFVEYALSNCKLINVLVFMGWLLGKGYLSNEKIRKFFLAWNESNGNLTMSDCLYPYDKDYALFPHGEGNEKAVYKSQSILAEFIAGQEYFESRLYDFAFKGKGWSSINQNNLDEVNKRIEAMGKVIKLWKDGEEDDFDKICGTSIEDINNKLSIEWE